MKRDRYMLEKRPTYKKKSQRNTHALSHTQTCILSHETYIDERRSTHMKRDLYR